MVRSHLLFPLSIHSPLLSLLGFRPRTLLALLLLEGAEASRQVVVEDRVVVVLVVVRARAMLRDPLPQVGDPRVMTQMATMVAGEGMMMRMMTL